MLKKIFSVIFTLCLMLSISAMAVETDIADSPQKPVQGEFDPSRVPQEGFESSEMPQGELAPTGDTDNKAPNAPEDKTSIQPDGNGEAPQTSGENDSAHPKNPWEGNGHPQFGGFPGGMGGFNMPNTQATEKMGFKGFLKTYFTPIISVILLGLAYLFVIFYKRKHY